MYIALISIIIFICVLLILVVLSQNSKGGGLSNQFGAGSSNLIGVKRTGDLLEKLTWGFAIALIVLSLASSTLLDNTGTTQSRSVNQERASQQGSTPVTAPAPVSTQPIPNATVPATNGTPTPTTTDSTQP